MRNQTIKHLIISITTALVLIQASHGATVRGASDCGKWLQEGQSNNAASLAMKAWLVGFMSGLNVMYEIKDGKTDALDNIKSNQQIYTWMDNYCQKNPLKEVDDGGIKLFIELMKK